MHKYDTKTSKTADSPPRRRSAKRQSDAVGFDIIPEGVTIAFYPRRPPPTAGPHWLWWALPASTEVVADVIFRAGDGSLPVDAIVIGGLDGYLVAMHQWPCLLAQWSRMAASTEIVVDTRGLTQRGRRRLIDATRRQLALMENDDPVAMVVAGVKRWLTGRRR